MATTPDSISPDQLKRARTQLWHQDGNALRTMDDARAWLNEAGLVPFYPHAQFAAAPQGSFAEAVLGRPENGWVPPETSTASGEDPYVANVDDEEPEDEADLDEDDDEEFADEEFADEEFAGPEASDDEVMLSDDDEFAEDEGDEIAEEDRIDAGVGPVPNGLLQQEAAPPVAAPDPVNGFSAEEKETVRRMLARMVAEGSAVPLNLLGSTTGEPDFICSAQAFSFVYTLRGDKGWKQEPSQTGSMRVSPLAVKVYEVLKEKGPMAPHELAAELAHGVVDSAVLRALSELWAIQRVLPVPDADGEPSKWELMSGRFIRHLKAGANAGQPTALSALVSLYLSQAVAASSDEMEIFLSPLAARSRIREVVGGLSASRQLDSLVVEGKTLLYMPGALDNLPAERATAEVPVAAPRSRYEDDDRRAMIEERAARFAAEGGEERRSKYPVRVPAGARVGDRESRPGARPGGPRPGGPERRPGFSGSRTGGGQGAGDRSTGNRGGGFGPPRRTGSYGGPPRDGGASRDDRERRPFQRRDESGAPERPRNEFARPWDGERKPFVRRDEGERRPYTPREGSGERGGFAPRKPFTPREGGGGRPFTARADGERRPFAPREGGDRRPFVPRENRPFTPREGGERRPFTPRADGERRPFVPRGDRPSTPREGGGERRPFTPRGDRPFTPREGGERRPFTPRGDRPFTPREGGERRPFTPRGDRPFTPREGGERRPFTPSGERRPFTPRPSGDRGSYGPRKPFGADRGGANEGRPSRDRFAGEAGEGRPSFPSGAKSAGPGGAKFGGSGFGRDRKGAPGSYGKPGFSPSRRGPGSGPGRGGAPKRRPE